MDVLLYNTSNSENIYVFIQDITEHFTPSTSTDMIHISKGDKISIKHEMGGSAVLTIYDSAKNEIWRGVVPLGMNLEFNPSTKMMKMNDETIPSKSEGNNALISSTSGKTVGIVIIIIIGLIIAGAIIYHMVLKKPGRKMRKIEY